MPFKLTTAQSLMLHIIESVAASVVITVVIGAVQFIATHGLNLAGLGATCVTLFIGALSMGYKSVTSNPNFGQAMLDSMNEIKGILPSVVQAAQTPQPPVIVNVSHPAQATVEPAVQTPPQVVQQPFPVTQTYPMPIVPKP